jgi:hypothetical protein
MTAPPRPAYEWGVPLPAALRAWCEETFGEPVVGQVFSRSGMADVHGVELGDGQVVVVKARAGIEQARACVEGQRLFAEAGFPCPAPLTAVAAVDGLAVHAEEFKPGGNQLFGWSSPVVVAFAELLARLVDLSSRLAPPPPAGTPLWVAWNHQGRELWAEDGVHDPAAGDPRVDPLVESVASRVRARLAEVRLPAVVGHSDWETQNMRWRGNVPYAVHDWDSLSDLPEAAHAGAASATFASDRQPLLVPLEQSAAFISTYESARGRTFTDEEREVAWAAGLWLASHNARMEGLYRKPPIVVEALRREADARLALAGA